MMVFVTPRRMYVNTSSFEKNEGPLGASGSVWKRVCVLLSGQSYVIRMPTFRPLHRLGSRDGVLC
jgi:hypothetical protein